MINATGNMYWITLPLSKYHDGQVIEITAYAATGYETDWVRQQGAGCIEETAVKRRTYFGKIETYDKSTRTRSEEISAAMDSHAAVESWLRSNDVRLG